MTKARQGKGTCAMDAWERRRLAGIFTASRALENSSGRLDEVTPKTRLDEVTPKTRLDEAAGAKKHDPPHHLASSRTAATIFASSGRAAASRALLNGTG